MSKHIAENRARILQELTRQASLLTLSIAALVAPAMAQTVRVVGTPEGSAPGPVGATALKGTIALGANGRLVFNHNDTSEDGYVVRLADASVTGAAGSRIDFLSGVTTLAQTPPSGAYAISNFQGPMAVHSGATLQLEGWVTTSLSTLFQSVTTGDFEVQQGARFTGQGAVANGTTSKITIAGTISPHGFPEHGGALDGPQGLIYMGASSGTGSTKFTSTSRLEIDIDPATPTGKLATDLLRLRSQTTIENGAQLQIRLAPSVSGPTSYQTGRRFVFIDMATDAAYGANSYAFAFDPAQGKLPSGVRATQYMPIGEGPAPKIGDVIMADGFRFIYSGGSLVQPRREVIGDFTLAPDSQTQLTHYLGLQLGSGFASVIDLTTGSFKPVRNSMFMEIVQTRAFADDADTLNGKSAANALEAVGGDNVAYTRIANLHDGDTTLDHMSPFFDALSGQLHVGVRGLLAQDALQTQRSVGQRLSAYEQGGAHVWAEAEGGRRRLDGDGGISSLREEGEGFLAGIDATLTGLWRVGVAGGYRTVDGEAADAFTGQVHFDQWQGLVYTSGGWGNLRAQAGLGVASAAIDTNRNVALPGILDDRLSAAYDGTTFHAFGELSYENNLGFAVMEPFLGYSVVRASTTGADETKAFAAGDSAVALHITGDQTQVSFATLGVKARTISMGPVSFEGLLGWRRGFGDLDLTGVHMLNNREGFAVQGASLSENAAVVELGGRWRVTNSLTLDVGYNGVIGDQSQDHSAHLGLALRF